MPVSGEGPKIGVVGHSRAGKSTFLAVLKAAFEMADWSADIIRDANAADLAANSLRQPHVYYQYLTRFIEEGFFPPATRVQETADRVTFKVQQKDGRGQFVLDCFDPAGEVLEGNYGENTREMEALKRIQASLRSCTGVLLLLDPEAPELWLKTWERVEQGLSLSLATAEKTEFVRGKPRVAVCFAKADADRRQRRFRIRDARPWLAGLDGGRNLINRLENRNLECAYHFVSATGWIAGCPNIRTLINARPIVRINANAAHNANIGNNPVLPGAQNGATLREMVPDPPQPLAPQANVGYRYMQGWPLFSDPLQIKAHDFWAKPLTNLGPRDMLANDERPQALELFGVHVGFGRKIDPQHASVRPWNVVEPVLWLAGYEL